MYVCMYVCLYIHNIYIYIYIDTHPGLWGSNAPEPTLEAISILQLQNKQPGSNLTERKSPSTEGARPSVLCHQLDVPDNAAMNVQTS